MTLETLLKATARPKQQSQEGLSAGFKENFMH